MYYALNKAKRVNVVTNLRDYDVVITTPHISMPEPIVQNVKFHALCSAAVCVAPCAGRPVRLMIRALIMLLE